MAYKIQVGSAKLGGTSIYEGSIDNTSNISGSILSGSGDILIAGGANNDAEAISAENGIAIVAASASFDRTANWLSIDNDSGLVIKRDNSGANTQLASFHATANGLSGSFQLSSTGSATVRVSCLGGALSGSGELQLGGNLVVTSSGNVIINGDLTVEGNSATLNVGEFTTTDSIIEIADSQDGNGYGLAFGKTGSAGVGGQILLDTTGTNEFEIVDGNGAGIALSASAFYGNGSSLTGLSSENSAFSVNTKTNNATASLGFNIINVNSSAQELRLLTGSALQGGDEIIIKRTDNLTNTLEIKPNGSDLIDGEASITLESGRAAVSLVYNNSGSFMIF